MNFEFFYPYKNSRQTHKTHHEESDITLHRFGRDTTRQNHNPIPKPREQSDCSLTTPIIAKEVMIREKSTKAT